MNKNNERISVIITAYNEEKTIERAIKSIHNQTYGDILGWSPKNEQCAKL